MDPQYGEGNGTICKGKCRILGIEEADGQGGLAESELRLTLSMEREMVLFARENEGFLASRRLMYSAGSQNLSLD